jgi:formylmethanofuran dehydrogenase subunit E
MKIIVPKPKERHQDLTLLIPRKKGPHNTEKKEKNKRKQKEEIQEQVQNKDSSRFDWGNIKAEPPYIYRPKENEE